MESQHFAQNIEDDRTVAWKILNALCQSSLKDEFEHYSEAVQKDLNLSSDQMFRVYSLSRICRLLEPTNPRRRFYKGVEIKEDISVSTLLDHYTVALEAHDTSNSVQEADESKPTLPTRSDGSVCQGHQVLSQIEENCEQECEVPDEPSSRSSSGEKNKHPAAKAMRKLLRAVSIPMDGLTLDTEKYEKALVVFGDTKPHKDQFASMGGKWNARLGAWVFSKTKLIEAMTVAQSRLDIKHDVQQGVQEDQQEDQQGHDQEDRQEQQGQE